MNNKGLYVIIAFLLVILCVVGYKAYSVSDRTLSPNEQFLNQENNPSNENKGNTLTDSLKNSKGYSAGDTRDISSLSSSDTSKELDIALIQDVKTIQNQNISYKFYRVGFGDAPPHYSNGQIIVEVTTNQKGPSRWYYFNTDIIDADSIESLLFSGEDVRMSCKTGKPNGTCLYTIKFQPDLEMLKIYKVN